MFRSVKPLHNIEISWLIVVPTSGDVRGGKAELFHIVKIGQQVKYFWIRVQNPDQLFQLQNLIIAFLSQGL